MTVSSSCINQCECTIREVVAGQNLVNGKIELGNLKESIEN